MLAARSLALGRSHRRRDPHVTVTNVVKDPRRRTLTITSEYAASAERVWKLWADPRQLARWWGPPTHPATVVEHDVRPGGHVAYHVTGPDGDRRDGWWHVIAVDAPRHLEFELGDPEVPTMTVSVHLDDIAAGGTRMSIQTAFGSDEDMAFLSEIGFAEGMASAITQIDDLLASVA
jgi:uncharacterized protein YndB with AHSA1/START domain